MRPVVAVRRKNSQPHGFSRNRARSPDSHLNGQQGEAQALSVSDLSPVLVDDMAPCRTTEGKKVVWRTDLRATERCWRGWFEGMSAAFLELSMPKV